MGNSATVGTLKAILAADSAQFTAAFAEASNSASLFSRDFTKVGVSAQQLGAAFTNSVERSLSNVTRLAKDFSGAPLAARADELAEAINRVGGASNLTAAEQQRVNAQVTEMIAKYRALGQEAPGQLVALANATKSAGEETSIFAEGFGRLTAAFSLGALIAQVVDGILDLAKSVPEAAAQLVHLNEKTGLSIGYLQQLKLSATVSGSSLEEFAQVAYKMGVNIQEGSTKTVLGLSELAIATGNQAFAWENLRKIRFEDAFKLVTGALTDMADAQQANALGTMIMGRDFGTMATAIHNHSLEMAKDAAVVGDAHVKAAARGREAWSEMWNAASQSFLGVFGQMAQGLENLRAMNVETQRLIKTGMTANDAQAKAAEEFDNATKGYIAAGMSLGDAQAKVSAQMLAAGGYANRYHDIVLGTAGAVHTLTDAEKLQAAVTLALTGATGQLTPEMKAAAQALIAHGQSAAEVITTLETALPLTVANKSAIEDLVKAHIKAEAAATVYQKAFDNLNSSAAQLTPVTQARVLALVAEGKSEHDIAIVLGIHEQQVKDLVAIYKEWEQAQKAAATAQDSFDKSFQHFVDSTVKEGRATLTAFNKSQQAQADASSHDEIQGLVAIDKIRKETASLSTKYTRDSYAAQHQVIEDWGQAQKDGFTGAAKDAAAFGHSIDENVTTKLENLARAHFEQSIGLIANAFGEIGRMTGNTGIGSIGGLISSISGRGGLMEAVRGFSTAGGLMTTLGSIASVAGPIAAIGGAIVGIIHGIGQLFSDHGRGQVVDFAAQFGGFDALHAHLQTLGKDGEQLWINLTQHTTDSATAKANIAAITQAFAAHAQQVQAVTNAQANFDALARSGTATAQQLADAWKQVGEAQTAAGQATTDLMDNPLFRQTTAFANQVFGLPDPATLQKTSQDMQDAYGVMVRSGTYTTDQLNAAWKKVADAENTAAGITPPTPPDFTSLTSEAQKYGITLDQLGKGFQAGKLAEDAKGFQDFYTRATAAGAQFGAFEPQLQAFFKQAQDLGAALPDSLKPLFQQMINLGDLVDANGNKITTLAGIAFSTDAPDPAQQAATQAALADSTRLALTAAQNLATSLGGGGADSLDTALQTANRLAGDFGNTLASWSFPNGGSGTNAPLMDQPMMSVTTPGMVRVTPGDWVGKPDLTDHAFAGGWHGDTPVMLHVPVYVGGRQVDDYVVETTLRKLESNDSGGAPVSYKTRWQKAIR